MDCADDNTSLRVASFACYLDAGKDNLLRKISSQDAPIVLNSDKAKPAPNANVGLTNLRVDSFSYLNNGGDRSFVFNVPKPIQNPPNAFTFPKESEIGVFGADKYFNALKLGHRDGIKRDPTKQVPINLPRVGSNPRIRPTSLCSEASTMNSRTALMPNGSNAKETKPSRRRFFQRFGCRGPCFDKKDVCIDKETCNSISMANPVQIHDPAMENFAKVANNLEESRTSIEVFGSGMASRGDVAANLERKLSMLTWDAIPKGGPRSNNTPPPASTVRSSTICDDMASDASSDLFEIENITGSMYPMLAMSEADVSGGCLSPVYAPSEASIQWSVITASAVDYSSALSDYYNDESVSVHVSRNNSRNVKNGAGLQGPKGRVGRAGGGLLGCKSQKALDVAENVVCCKNSEKVKN